MKSLSSVSVPNRKVLIGAGILACAGLFWIYRVRSRRPQPLSGGMKVGFCPNEINLEVRYGTENDRDVVDQASWESFPCSDPPAY